MNASTYLAYCIESLFSATIMSMSEALLLVFGKVNPDAALAEHGVVDRQSGEIQLYFRKDVLGEQSYDLFKLLDIGDIVGVEGPVFTTHTGETTIRVEKWTLLSKIPAAAAGKISWPDR